MTNICVFCGSSDSIHPEYFSAARRMGQTLAERGMGLIYGGGKTGLMGALADGAIQAGGEVTGVIVTSMNTPALAHPGLARMDVSINMHHRKARMHELADAYIALPGGLGTFDELFETLTWSQTGEHEKPVGLLNIRDYFIPLLAAIDFAVAEGFIFPEHRAGLCCESDPQKLLDAMQKYVHPHDAVKRWMRSV
jgi:hypothetical protein